MQAQVFSQQQNLITNCLFNMPMPSISILVLMRLHLQQKTATPTHRVLTNFALDPAQPIQGADRPSGPQAYAKG